MPYEMYGNIYEVSTEATGADVLESAVAGATSVRVDDVYEFEEAGGQALIYINGDETDPIIYYTGVDEESSSLIFDLSVLDEEGLQRAITSPVDLEVGTSIHVYPLSLEKRATVVLNENPEDESVRARVPHSMAGILAEGPRTDSSGYESVSIVQDESDWVIYEIIGEPVILNVDGVSDGTIDTIIDSVPSPDQPSGVLVTTVFNISNYTSLLDVSWTPPTEIKKVKEYSIRYGTGTSNWSYLTVNKSDTSVLIPVAADTNYYVAVQSVSMTGSKSSWINADVYPIESASDTLAPEQVSGLSWVVDGTSWKATWTGIDLTGSVNQNNDFLNYEVRVTNSSTDKYYSTTDNQFTFSLSDNRAAFGTPKSPLAFAIRSVDRYLNRSAWTTVAAVANPAPSAVTVTGTAGIETINLRWTENTETDISGYNIYRSTTNGFTPEPTNFLTSTKATSYTYDSVVFSPQYFHVRAVDVFGQESSSTQTTGLIPKTAVIVDTTAPNTPTGVGVTSGFDLTNQQSWVQATWTASTSTDLSRHEVRYSSDGTNFNYQTVNKGTNTLRLFVEPGKPYYVSVRAIDWTGNASAFVNATTYPITSVADTTAPSQPATPSVTGGVMNVFVSHDNTKQGGGAIESDTVAYEVYGSTTTGFTPASANRIGRIERGTVTSGSFSIPATKTNPTWYFKVIAVDRSGNRSVASNESSTTVGVVSAGSVDQAILDSITNAQTAADNALVSDDYVVNPYFDNWPSGQSIPSSWGQSNGTPIKETTIYRTGPYALRYNVTANTNSFVGQIVTTLDNPQYLTVTFDFYLSSGDLGGAGALVRWTNTASSVFDVIISFATELGTSTPATGKWYRVTKTVKRPSGFTGTFGNLQVFPMAGWTSIGTITAKSMIFDRASLRPATSAEILSYEAPTVTSMNNAITTSANGKNKVTYSASAASGTTGYVSGDIWYQLSSGTVVGFWIYSGSAWIPQTLTNAVISSLDAGKINTGLLSAARIAAGSLDVSKLAVADFTEYTGDGKFMNQANWTRPITVNTTEPNYVQISSAAATNGDTFSNYWYGVSTGDTFYVSYEVYADPANTTWNAVNVGMNIVSDSGTQTWTGFSRSAAQMQASAGTWLTVSGTVTVAFANARRARAWFSVPGNGTDGNIYRFRNLNIRKRFGGELIVDGGVKAINVDTNAINTRHLTVGAMSDNLVPNGKFEDLMEGWTPNTSGGGTVGTVTGVAGTAGANALRLVRGTNNVSAYTQLIPVSANEALYWSFWGSATTALASGFYFRLAFYNSSKTLISNVDVYANGALTTTMTQYQGSLDGTTSSNTPKIPASAAYVQIQLHNATSGTSTMYVSEVDVRTLVGNAMIANAAITNAKIADATIQSAKIANLEANKLTAGTGIITDLVIGNASQAGSIKSYGYVAGTTGYSLEKTTLEINEGLVRARALELSYGNNVFNPLYSDFESRNSSMPISVTGGSATFNSFGYFGDKSLRFTTSTTTGTLFLGSSDTDYNFSVEAGKTYIASCYMKTTSGTPAFSLRMKWDNGTTTSPVYQNASTSWTRYSATFTVPAGVSKAELLAYSTTSGAVIDVDGIQVEEKTGATNTPSPWTPPSRTTVNGGQITTGTIASNNYVANVSGWAIGLDGSVEFGEGTFRGIIKATGGEIADAIKISSAGSFYIGDSPTDYLFKLSSQSIDTYTNLPIPKNFNYFYSTSKEFTTVLENSYGTIDVNVNQDGGYLVTQKTLLPSPDTTTYRLTVYDTSYAVGGRHPVTAKFIRVNDTSNDFRAIVSSKQEHNGWVAIGNTNSELITNASGNYAFFFSRPAGWAGEATQLIHVPGLNTNTLFAFYNEGTSFNVYRRYGSNYATYQQILSGAIPYLVTGNFSYSEQTGKLYVNARRNSDSVYGILEVDTVSLNTVSFTPASSIGMVANSSFRVVHGYLFYSPISSTNGAIAVKPLSNLSGSITAQYHLRSTGNPVFNATEVNILGVEADSSADVLSGDINLTYTDGTANASVEVNLSGGSGFNVDYSRGYQTVVDLKILGQVEAGTLRSPSLVSKSYESLYIATGTSTDPADQVDATSAPIVIRSTGTDVILDGTSPAFTVSEKQFGTTLLTLSDSGSTLNSSGSIGTYSASGQVIVGNNVSHGGVGSRLTVHTNSGLMYYTGSTSSMLFRVTESGVYGQSGVSARSVFVNSNGIIGYNSSTLKVKDMIMPADFEMSLRSLDIDLWSYKYRDDNLSADGKRHWGVIAEQAHYAGLYDLVYYEDPKVQTEETIDGFAYEKLAAYHGPVIKWTYEEVLALKEENATLKATVEKQGEELTGLTEKVRQIMESMLD